MKSLRFRFENRLLYQRHFLNSFHSIFFSNIIEACSADRINGLALEKNGLPDSSAPEDEDKPVGYYQINIASLGARNYISKSRSKIYEAK